MRQFLDFASPTNFFWSNPLALWKFTASGGQSMVDGLRNLAGDLGKGDVSIIFDASWQPDQNLTIVGIKGDICHY